MSMDLDDSFTEGLIQRMKARKEYLNKKKTEFVGKKRAVLIDEHQVNSDEPPNKSPKYQSAHSPHNKENDARQNEDSNALFVPVISSSDNRGLAALRSSHYRNEQPDKYSKWQSAQTLETPYSNDNKENTDMQNEDSNSLFAAGLSAGKTRGLAALKKSYFGSEEKDSNLHAPSEFQENPISSNSQESITETSDVFTKKLEDTQQCNNGHTNEINCTGNSSNIKFDHNSNIKMELSSLSSKQTKENVKLPIQKNFVAAKIPVSSDVQDSSKLAVDPAELPLSARKALFENALINGTPKTNKDITDHKLSVAERAAMFENASKISCRPPRTNFNIPKGTARTDLAKFDESSRGSPVKTVQPVMKMTPDIVKASPIKDIVSPPLSSSPLPSKHNGNHIAFIQQKLNEKSNTQKEVEATVPEIPKQEISSLVHQWEKLSSSSEKSSLNEERKDFASKEQESYDSDVNETSEHESEQNLSNEMEHAVFDNEQKDDCSNEDSDISDVFNEPDTEEVSLKAVECGESTFERIDSSASSQNVGNIIGPRSPSLSGISSYTDSSSYSASGSQSCTSGSSVGSYNANQDLPEDKKEKNPDVPLLYTVSFYRKQKQETRLTPVRTVVHCNLEKSPESPNADHTEYIQERIKALQEEILRQQTVISQTSQALNLCSATAEFSGSMEQVEGERLLLISTQKRQACLNEVTRLKAFGSQGENISDGKGTLTISDLQLPLKREFIASQLEGKGTDTVHYFLCLIRHGAQVIVTQMMSTDDKTSDGALCFTNHIQMQNLPADYSVIFEVYALQTKKEVLSHEKKYHIKREHSKIRLTPKGKKSDGKILLPAISSPGGPSAVRSPSFGVVGYTRFTLLNCTKKTFTLDKVPYTSPLEGVLRVKLQLHAEHKVIEKGFLTMFEDVSGFGAWHRRWCALNTNYLSYWKYPDDEHKKEPVGMIDLKQCVTSEVKLAPRDICARPHTLQLVTVRPQEKGDKNTLISRSVNTLTTTKHLLSADTKEERILWCNKLNEALASVRKWDPRALKPVNTSVIAELK